ncbi:hypothetical protein GUJ93_ZPchr0008g11739 [Zizania palustris]|nr:hypothetical protein GUJ93_ZPchr0008g11739 [Zizania palustris]
MSINAEFCTITEMRSPMAERTLWEYRKEGLQNADLLEKMFEDIRNTVTDHWSLGQGTVPTPNSDAININDEHVK